ncbi:MAG: hypothetical protein CBB62_10345 [Micavibrio sp. TMED2]|nr:hypothetical protein [Alphaproteobacteria bacterium]MAS47754.1 hypothetical protein [Alphaproteobacteria bacterium]MAX96917.1 hypothetical protein [Alphaproteobacteria bacterium]OUT40184.1 MAG: hypothetical protein CBB62_10345 [Micavibrio sp. TMED2]HAG46671.1 hypothetical protein [Gammaproteobacteria bacterium]
MIAERNQEEDAFAVDELSRDDVEIYDSALLIAFAFPGCTDFDGAAEDVLTVIVLARDARKADAVKWLLRLSFL